MTEQAFLESLHQSLRESEQLQLALGRVPQRATLEQALAQVQMLREAHDFEKLAEIRETVLRYFTLIDGYDCEADLENMTALVRELHACPESYTRGQLQPGELILAMWMAEVPFKRFKYQDLPETVVFAVDWDDVSDPANYIDNFHGFENLLRPSSGWFKPEGDRVSIGGGVDFLCLNPKVSEGALAGPFPVCGTC